MNLLILNFARNFVMRVYDVTSPNFFVASVRRAQV